MSQELKAGPELDNWIAVNVLGWKPDNAFHPSSSVEHCWYAMLRLRHDRGWRFKWSNTEFNGYWTAWVYDSFNGTCLAVAHAEEPRGPDEAMCLAIRKAVLARKALALSEEVTT